MEPVTVLWMDLYAAASSVQAAQISLNVWRLGQVLPADLNVPLVLAAIEWAADSIALACGEVDRSAEKAGLAEALTAMRAAMAPIIGDRNVSCQLALPGTNVAGAGPSTDGDEQPEGPDLLAVGDAADVELQGKPRTLVEPPEQAGVRAAEA